ncbi:tRNA pseudouridine(55) synthase TruB [Trinickia caryophylli]|uniref:tRNA pseudouridine synthase B n=1 Tax=Trinickia caryophylli TaxID=28094 RepID=A0A1X7G953_TRICW|nr:tRNA pseudouridine(55) synthase TruB [Trinickia caryophylli]PMS11402.1 tRNA pseudouridine(55) synthase TruB [Trinickia caryophylli]TRX17597.1 tRNA pseudouridine(55) synthase TruB [Trinickia caryophylli]WQE11650.1 tRNA pseudouridine(55) synthase TruB [Trinickia caryophylli]SMF66099.1 tRNA pseudouridine synthase B [Trinickia caryophylli]GLU34834.1 tRNA pseudouridine synthase B [Trinickia caryophylli]
MSAPQRPRVPRRDLDGVLLLDKPVGLSSNDALMCAKRLYLAKKAGHTGTLDPLASGLLPLCFGEATKFSQDLLEADKTYEATMRLGVRTTTGDAEGEVLETREVRVDPAALDSAMAGLRGQIVQVPPMYSALKRDGKPLYEYARAGQTVEREGRVVTIHSLELLACALPDVTFRVKCSKGTYVRTLAEDIGAALGCGAHLVALRRTGVGALTLEHAVTLDALSGMEAPARDAMLQPVDALLSTFAPVRLAEEAARRFQQGQRLRVAELASTAAGNEEGVRGAGEGARVRVYRDADGALLGVARVVGGVLAPERLVVMRP